MPPVTQLEEYLDLSRRIEETAAELGLPIQLEGYHPPSDHRARAPAGHARSRRDRGEHPPGALVARARRQHHRALRGGASECRLASDKFMVDGRHTGTGGGNHITLGGATPARQPVLAPARPAAQLHQLLAQPPVALVPVLGPVRRSHQPGAAHRRGAPRQPVRARHRLRRARPSRTARRRPGSSIACSATCSSTSPATRTAPRCASTSCTAPTRPRVARACVELRAFEMPPDCAHELRRAAAGARLVAWFWREPYERQVGALGHARSSTASCCRTSCSRTSRTSSPTCSARASRSTRRWYDAAVRVPLPVPRARGQRRRRARAAPGHRALARARRAARRRRHGALRRLVGRARAGAGAQHDRHAPRGRLQWATRAAASDRHRRRVRGGRALPRLEAADRAASDDSRARTAGVRPARQLVRSLARRLHLPRRTSGRAARTRTSRATRSRPRAGAWRASSRSGTARARSPCRRAERSEELPLTLDLRRPHPLSMSSSPACFGRTRSSTASTLHAACTASLLRAAAPASFDETQGARRQRCVRTGASSSSSSTRSGRASSTRRWEKAQHLLHENGVSYNVYGDPQRHGAARGTCRPSRC